MNKIIKRVALLAAVLLAPSMAQAQLIDQSNYGSDGVSGPYTGVGYSNTSMGNVFFGQYFVPQQNNIIGASIILYNDGTTAKSFYLGTEVYDATDTFVTDGSNHWTNFLPGTYLIATVPFTPALVTPGQTYYLDYVILNDDFSLYDSEIHYVIDTNELYPDGVAFRFDMENNNYSESGDMVFEEYYEGAATPEPASMVLLATGLVGVIGVARRRRKQA
ncbi:MAG: PEP-CTERM sorting domain-containing protein [Gemmatimonadota bacterium]